MEIIDAFWEQRNLGISCSEIKADTGDTVKGMLEALALLTSQYQVIKLPVSRYDLMRVVEQHGFSFIEGSMNVVHNLKNIDRSGIQKRLNDRVCYEEMDEVKKRRDIIFCFTVVLPGDLFCPGKYPKHLNQQKK